MNSALYTGTVRHCRYIPKHHSFSYPFFMYFLNLGNIEKLPDFGYWFSTKRWALSRFHRPDYFGKGDEPIGKAIARCMEDLTDQPVTGEIYGLMNMRTLGIYFSPVNFYYGFDQSGQFSHFLAEVSNTPWNERHQYAHFVGNGNLQPSQDKVFKVSPFNPVRQRYSWSITPPDDTLGISIKVDDSRGHVFDASITMHRAPLTQGTIRKQLLRRPVMTAYTISRIYWQALIIYLKRIPYIPYTGKPHEQRNS